ncbi:MAG: glycoside hydrolase family 2 TIM barrel-domain containing protein [Kiritimatiellales bacterium]
MLRPQQNEIREVNSLDGFWDFQTSDGAGREYKFFTGLPAPRKLGVPGSWNEQNLDIYNHFSEGWYQKDFFVAESWKHRKIFIWLGSVCQNADVWINGVWVGSHTGPHLPFEFEITKLVKFGKPNRLTVLADGTLHVDSLPPATMSTEDLRTGWSTSFPPVAYDFFPFSGIHRSVYLYAVQENYLTDIHIQTSHSNNVANITCFIQCAAPFTGTVRLVVDGQEISEPLKDTAIADIKLKIKNPKLWDIGCGNLYNLTIILEENGEIIDCYRTRFGIRNVEVVGNKFLLNGKPVHFKGFGKHEDFDVIGKGLNLPLIIKDFDLMKWVGANSFRTSHYPYAEEWLDIADEHGILVISENPLVGLGPRLYREDILEKAVAVTEEHIKRDRNHPSVIMWSLANEPNSPACLDNEKKKNACLHFYNTLIKTVRRHDTSRPLTYAMHIDPADNPMAHLFDVLCINKYYGWYDYTARIEDGLEPLLDKLQDFYDTFKKPILLSEFGADAVSGKHHLPEVMFSEEFQSKIIKVQYEALCRKPWFIGAHVWNFADFRVGQTLTRVIFNRKGVFTRSRQPKLAAHTLKTLWDTGSAYAHSPVKTVF